MEEYRINNAVIRVHGSYDPEKLRESTIRFLKQAQIQRKKKKAKQAGGKGEIHND